MAATNEAVLWAERVLVGGELEPVEGYVISVEGGRIVSMEAGSSDASAVDLTGLTLLPGFIDSHVHMGFARPQEVLFGGVTTVRDLAWPPDLIFPLAKRSREPGFRGPLILAAGQMLTVPNGYPTRAEWAPPGTGRVMSDLDDARAAVASMDELGASVIKVALNSFVGTSIEPEMLRVVVDEAHARGLKVTGHVHGLGELHKALDAGMDEIAHMLMSEEAIPDETNDRMVDAGMAVVPTLSIRFDADQEMAISNLERFLGAGGKVVYGTDLGNEGPTPGIDGRETKAMARAGMTPGQIIRSATTDAAEWLGSTDRGSLAPGMVADVIGVEGDPLQDVGALPRVRFVMREGKVFLSPGKRTGAGPL